MLTLLTLTLELKNEPRGLESGFEVFGGFYELGEHLIEFLRTIESESAVLKRRSSGHVLISSATPTTSK